MPIQLGDKYIIPNDEIPITEIKFIQGGWVTVPTLVARDNIDQNRLLEGQIIYVEETEQTYITRISLGADQETVVVEFPPFYLPSTSTATIGTNLTELNVTHLTSSQFSSSFVKSNQFELDSSKLSDGIFPFLIKSGSMNPVKVRNDGIIILDEYLYTPKAAEGSLLYSSSNFFLGFPEE